MELEFSGFFRDVSKEEFLKFGEYLSSGYFGIPKRMLKLYTLLKQNSDDPANCTLTREEITLKLFESTGPKEKASVRKLISEFKQYFREFTAQQVYNNSFITKAKCELEWYSQKQNYTEYDKKTKEIIEHINNNIPRDEEYYHNLTEIYSKHFNKTDYSLGIQKNNELQRINDNLDKYFASMKIFLLQRSESLNYTTSRERNFNVSFKEPLLEYINSNSEEFEKDHPEIYLRYIAYLLDKNGYDENLFNKYLAILDSASKRMNMNENSFYSTLLNMISKFINNGAFYLDEKVIEIGDILIKKNITGLFGISYIDLLIISESYIGIKNISGGLAYLEKTKEHINSEDKINVYYFLKAKLLFFSGNYTESRNLLNKITIEDFIYYCEARLIELRISLIENNTDAVLNISENVLKYLKKHTEIGGHYLAAYKIFINAAREFAILKNKNINNNDRKYYSFKLKESIENNPVNCYARNWLLGLISEFEK